MANCEFCGAEVHLAYICTYCKGAHCGDHRLPEHHSCWNMGAVKARPSPFKVGMPSQSPTEEFKRVWGGIGRGSNNGTSLFDSTELKHLTLAWLAISFAFSVFWLINAISIFPLMFGVTAMTAGLGFILHELAHKYSAQKYGLLAEFRAWKLGLIMSVMFAFVTGGTFIFAAPGAVYIRKKSISFGNDISTRENGIISIVGPITNVIIAGFFFLLYTSGIGGDLGLIIGWMGVRINLFLAAFNMIPFGMFDGQKVFAWNKLYWAILAIPLLIGVFTGLTNLPSPL